MGKRSSLTKAELVTFYFLITWKSGSSKYHHIFSIVLFHNYQSIRIKYKMLRILLPHKIALKDYGTYSAQNNKWYF